jgi:tetratricopeptide (TPR) repeat protein
MSEMLGNRYFLARKFDRAIPELEKAVQDSLEDHKIKKKLIICYVQVGQIERALRIFWELIQKDPFIIINTDPYYDDCHCTTLVVQWENIINYKNDGIRMEYVALGILYLYCDVQKSITYFEQALEIMDNDTQLKKILNLLRNIGEKTSYPF